MLAVRSRRMLFQIDSQYTEMKALHGHGSILPGRLLRIPEQGGQDSEVIPVSIPK
jgi:hypothetical protein